MKDYLVHKPFKVPQCLLSFFVEKLQMVYTGRLSIIICTVHNMKTNSR